MLEEIETYELYKDLLVRNTNKLFSQYQDGKFDYSTYKEKLRHVLKDKTKKDWINYYDSYIYSLLKQMEFYNAEIFSDLSGQVRKAKPKLVAKKAPTHIEIDLPRKELKKAVERMTEKYSKTLREMSNNVF